MLVARANYIGLDRPDLQFCAKEAFRSMSKPWEKVWVLLKMFVTYPIHEAGLVIEYRFEECGDEGVVVVYTNIRSTSGAVLCIGSHAVETWSTTQAHVTLSSAEAEVYAIAQAGREGLGSAIAREGAGAMNHDEILSLWIRESVTAGDFRLRKSPRELNVADVLTHVASSSAFVTAGVEHGLRLEVVLRRAEGGSRSHVQHDPHAYHVHHRSAMHVAPQGFCSVSFSTA